MAVHDLVSAVSVVAVMPVNTIVMGPRFCVTLLSVVEGASL
jgi:hypothetical protein